MNEFTVGTALEFVRLTVKKRPFPEAPIAWDRNTLDVDITIVIGSWYGQVKNAYMRAEDFTSLLTGLRSLVATLSGEAVLSTLEDWIELKVVGDGMGHISVSGTAIDLPGTAKGNQLKFVLPDMDQTQLPSLIAQLESLVAAYPVL